jgi:hypothetical protein
VLEKLRLKRFIRQHKKPFPNCTNEAVAKATKTMTRNGKWVNENGIPLPEQLRGD